MYVAWSCAGCVARNVTYAERQKAVQYGRPCLFFLAGADGNRTHRGRDAPPIGFEDRERHQATYYSRALMC